MNVVLLSGSPSAASRSNLLLDHATQRLANVGARCHTVVLRELPAQPLLQADLSNPIVQTALARVHAAELVVVATPIYKAAYSGLLKTFLDLLPQDGLRGKTVLPIATGGSIAHLLAVDYALKPVLHALGSRHIAGGVFVTDAQLPRAPHGGYTLDRTAIERLDRALLGVFEAPVAADASC
jgi:FMN reductase